MVSAQLKELLLQSLVHEKGGVLIYRTALECARNGALRTEWTRFLGETETHVTALTRVCEALKLDPGEMTPGCMIVDHTGKALCVAMQMALAEGDPAAAELVACDCVSLAEAKDHANWELLGQVAEMLEGEAKTLLTQAYQRIEGEEDQHLYHSQGWARELWLKSLGLKAVIPPPEERKSVTSASSAEKARKSR